MPARIDDVTIKPVRLTPTEAELAVEVTYSPAPAACELHGRLMGPTCAYSTTVEVAYPIRKSRVSEDDPRKLIGRVIIPEPSWWDPDSPFLYTAVVELWSDTGKIDATRFSCGLRTAKLTPNGLWWNGRSLDLQTKLTASQTEAEWVHARAEGFNGVKVPASVAGAAWDYGDRFGLLIVPDQPARVDTIRHPSALGWMSDGDLRLN
jgi:hypothetical protein